MVVKPAFLISLLARESVPLASEATETGLAVWRVFLAIDQLAGPIDDHVGAAQVIPQLILDSRRCIALERAADSNESNPSLVIHDVERIVF
jgi:hypothetical protein